MKKLFWLIIMLLNLASISFSQEYVGKIIRSKDSVFINGKYFDKTKSNKNIAVGDEIKICCGGTIVIHFEKNASIFEKEKTLKNIQIKILKPKDDKNLMNKKYAAYTTLSASSRGGIFEPPLNPPNGATAFLDESVEFLWNKIGNYFYLKNSKNKIVFKTKIENSKSLELIPKEKGIKKGKYFWYIDDSEQVEINFEK